MIRKYIRYSLMQEGKKIKKENGKFATIQAQSVDDMSQILNWLKLNRAVKDIGNIVKSGNSYFVKVKVASKFGRQGVFNLVKDRFGMFARVK
jgi:methionyl-tRNA synthetase